MSTDQQDLALGKFTRLQRKILEDQKTLGAQISAFADKLKENTEAVRVNTVSVLDGEGWTALLGKLLADSDRLAALVNEANAQAGLCGETEIRLMTYHAPR